MTFAELGLCEPILRAIRAESYINPTPIQAKAIPHVLAGRDVLGCAQTGTGKTAAFALPIAHRLAAEPVPAGAKRPIRALVLSPTRELALQIAENLSIYARHTGLRHAVIFGGVNQNPQVRALKAGVDIVVATPGRLEDLMQQGHVDLRRVSAFVLDEADRMLDMGFIQPIRRIAAALPAQRQTLLFSATMPKEIRHLADALLKNPASVEVTPVGAAANLPSLIEQSVYLVSRDQKPEMLTHVLKTSDITRALVFTRTKHGADKVVRRLSYAGIRAEAIHGNKRQNVRQRTLDNFKSGRTSVLVATDIASRGIDVDDVSHVINYELPHEPETYVHRIGRTGRAGNTGVAIAFCDRDEQDNLRAIERLVKRPIAVAATPRLERAPAEQGHAHADARERAFPHPPHPARGPQGGRPPQPRGGRHPQQGRQGDRRSAAPQPHAPSRPTAAKAAAPSRGHAPAHGQPHAKPHGGARSGKPFRAIGSHNMKSRARGAR